MKIEVNSHVKDVSSKTISQLIAELGYTNMRLALALNGEFVPKGEWANVAVKPDAKIEIVAPMQGG